MPVRDFIQDIINGESSVPANCEPQYIKAVLARLKGAARDSIYRKSFTTINELIKDLKQRFALRKTYAWYLHEISIFRMKREESVSEFFDRITLLKSGAQAALEDKYENACTMLAPLNDSALEAFVRGLADEISGLVEARNPVSLDEALKIALEYESRHQLNPQYSTNYYRESRYPQPSFSGSRDRSPSPHVRFATTPDTYKHPDSRQNTPGIIKRPYSPGIGPYRNNFTPQFQYAYMPYNPYPYFPPPPMQGSGYPNPNFYQKGSTTPPRFQSPAPINSEPLNSNFTRRTDAARDTEKSERQTSVRLLKKLWKYEHDIKNKPGELNINANVLSINPILESSGGTPHKLSTHKLKESKLESSENSSDEGTETESARLLPIQTRQSKKTEEAKTKTLPKSFGRPKTRPSIIPQKPKDSSSKPSVSGTQITTTKTRVNLRQPTPVTKTTHTLDESTIGKNLLRRRMEERRNQNRPNYQESSTESDDESRNESDASIPTILRKNRSVLPSLDLPLTAFPSLKYQKAPQQKLQDNFKNYFRKNLTKSNQLWYKNKKGQ